MRSIPSAGTTVIQKLGAALSTSVAYSAAFVYMTWYVRSLAAFRLREMFIPTRADIKTLLCRPGRILRQSDLRDQPGSGQTGTETQL